jgi:hypothetical protein
LAAMRRRARSIRMRRIIVAATPGNARGAYNPGCPLPQLKVDHGPGRWLACFALVPDSEACAALNAAVPDRHAPPVVPALRRHPRYNRLERTSARRTEALLLAGSSYASRWAHHENARDRIEAALRLLKETRDYPAATIAAGTRRS